MKELKYIHFEIAQKKKDIRKCDLEFGYANGFFGGGIFTLFFFGILENFIEKPAAGLLCAFILFTIEYRINKKASDKKNILMGKLSELKERAK